VKEQFGQAWTSAVPHIPQNRISGGLSKPQLGHFITEIPAQEKQRQGAFLEERPVVHESLPNWQ
jgi:hypothetical protein